MIRLIWGYWRDAIMVCRALGNYGTPFKAGRGVTQGGPLSAKLFNIMVDVVARKWLRELREGGDYEEWERGDLMSAFFAIFCVDDAYLASRDPEFLQRVLDLLVSLFARVGLETNMSKMQTMICTPGRIRTQLPADSYRRMQCGLVTAAEWNARDVECFKCGKMVKATSLRRHLADMHSVYQQTVVAEDMLICRPAETYVVSESSPAGLLCPFPECNGLLKSGWMMRRHFRDVHPKDLVRVPKEGRKFSRCWRCGMQVDPKYTGHQHSKECQVGVERRQQREAAVTSALALRQQFSVNGESRRGEQYRTAGGGSNRWTWTSTMQLDQTSDSPEYIPPSGAAAGKAREQLG
jgi:hypothetical protein